MIEIIKLVLDGGMVEYHGEFFDFDRLQMSPAPSKPVPFYVGGHTEVALKRAARIGDGWTSAMMKFDDLVATMARLDELRAEYGRAELPFEIQAVCIDRFGKDGYAEMAEAESRTASSSRGSSTASDSTLRSRPSRIRCASSPISTSTRSTA